MYKTVLQRANWFKRYKEVGIQARWPCFGAILHKTCQNGLPYPSNAFNHRYIAVSGLTLIPCQLIISQPEFT